MSEDDLIELPPVHRAVQIPMAAPPKPFYYKPAYPPATLPVDTPVIPVVTMGRAVNKPLEESPRDSYVKHDDGEYEVDGVHLSDEQIAAAEATMASPKRVRVITGRAGAGKSLIIKWLRQTYGLTTMATTGKAAVGVNGATVHSVMAMKTEPWGCFNPGYRDYMMRQTTRDLILDEASMCGEKMACYIGEVLEKYSKRIILVGDWAQAKPVKDGWVFNTSFWRDALFTRLNESHRQSDRVFIDALDAARRADINPSMTDVFRSCVDPFPRDIPGVVRGYATNRMTDEYNDRKLREHVNATGYTPTQLTSLFFDNRDPLKQQQSPRNGKYQDDAIDDARLAHQAWFVKGAQVLITKNSRAADTEVTGCTYVNGDTGVVEDLLNAAGEPLDPTKPWLPDDVAAVLIKRHRDDALIELRRTKVEFKDARDSVTHYVLGFSVVLGYALTLHRCQGMTVDNLWLDMRSILSHPREGRHGLGYVGLSRTRTLQGLKISEFIPEALVCDDVVKPWI